MVNQVVYSSIPSIPVHIGSGSTSQVKKVSDIHFHDEIEFLRVEHGQMSCVINGYTHIISEGETAFINTRIPHETYVLKEGTVSSLVQINMDGFSNNNTSKYLSRFLRNGENQFVLFDRTNSITKELSTYIDNILNEYATKNHAYETYIKASIFNIFAFLYRHGVLVNPDSIFVSNKIINILPALQYIEQHFQDAITLDKISLILNLNRYYFCRVFKKATNSTFTEYLNFVRVCMSEKLLTTTSKSIMEISLETGFSSVSYFNRIFKRYRNCTPTAYRKIKYSLI